ncbi:alpha/beta hydrolase [Croceiramulus getboli]|nr:alpha/beta hydrolase-fold protein [Flavobacteriaceae bacterium YJPT1-3]
MRNTIFLLILIGLLHATSGFAQEVMLQLGIKDNVYSNVLNENRAVVINLPEDYETSKESYPILYVLDGSNNNLLEAIQVTRKLNVKMIIVAIPNTDRDRDMMPLSTPTYTVEHPEAEHFLAFLGEELLPYVEKNYRSNGQKDPTGQIIEWLVCHICFSKKACFFRPLHWK